MNRKAWAALRRRVRREFGVSLEEWLSAGWWQRSNPGYRTPLGLATHIGLLVEGFEV